MKQIVTLSILIIYLFQAEIKCQNINNGLVAEFLFDNGSKYDSISGITLLNNTPYPTSDRNSISNSAYYFPGGSNSFFDAGDSFDSLISGNNATFSFSMWLWLETDTTNSTYFILSKRSDNTCSKNERQIYFAVTPQKRLRVVLSGTLGANNFIWEENTQNTLVDSTWYHIVFTYDFQQNERNLFVNCLQDSLRLNQTLGLGLNNGMVAGNAHLGFGAMLNDSGNLCHPSTFSGKLDDIRFYNRVLTNADIETLCNYTNATNTTIFNSDRFLIYPNPSDGDINIEHTHGNTILTIYNLSGIKVCQHSIENIHEHINLNLAPGTYFATLNTEKSGVLNKILIIK